MIHGVVCYLPRDFFEDVLRQVPEVARFREYRLIAVEDRIAIIIDQ